NMNDYYDVALKESRADILSTQKGEFSFHQIDISDADALNSLFGKERFTHVIHLAAQAGVRYSITNPSAYVSSNLVGFMNILEACRAHKPEHLVYASSSSVYGMNTVMPYSVHHNVDHPVSLYAATKKSNELLAHSYSHLYGLPTTGLRFFTVYGPWGRPDMAYFKFADAIMKGKSIDVYNNGNMKRDFTYVDDIVEGIVGVMTNVPKADGSWDAAKADPGTSSAPYRIYNIGNNNPVVLSSFIETLESHLGKKAVINYLPIQPGDVLATYADIDDLNRDTGYKPATDVNEGLKRFVKWFKEYYGY
ncbi:MAG TPA: NAD-dependent epimerase, partial [Spirochaetota bacterium]|nr:NAD-dependent epimerase [Spirochaetota bacterium]